MPVHHKNILVVSFRKNRRMQKVPRLCCAHNKHTSKTFRPIHRFSDKQRNLQNSYFSGRIKLQTTIYFAII